MTNIAQKKEMKRKIKEFDTCTVVDISTDSKTFILEFTDKGKTFAIKTVTEIEDNNVLQQLLDSELMQDENDEWEDGSQSYEDACDAESRNEFRKEIRTQLQKRISK